VCGAAVAAGNYAYWDNAKKTVTCMSCLHASALERAQRMRSRPALDRGRPGASAEREHRRRRGDREARTRSRHPLLGGLLLALWSPPQHETAFRQGSRGEQALARALERSTASSPAIILHDRRMPGGRGNIDHLAVAASGVYVIDSKNVSGRVRVTGGLFGEQKLRINSSDRSKFADGLDRQTAAVRAVLERNGRGDVPVQGVLCFGSKADLPLFGSSRLRGHRLHYRRALARALKRKGRFDASAIAVLARELAVAFPAA
jgi:hypothetical protein